MLFAIEKFRELKKRLQPSIEQLVRTNRKNFLKLGFIFKKYAKGGKAYHRGNKKLKEGNITIQKIRPIHPMETGSNRENFDYE